MGFTKGPVVEQPLKQHPGILRYATSWEVDGLSNVWMDFVLMDLAANVIGGKVVVRNDQGALIGEHLFDGPPNEFGNMPLHVIATEAQLPDVASNIYGEWTADITIRVNNSTTSQFGWEYDGRFLFNVGFTAAPPNPCDNCAAGTHCENGVCVPDVVDPCAHCGTGTHCENGTCVPDPEPPGWLEKLKALFPAQLQQYAVPITMGVVVLAYQGIKKK